MANKLLKSITFPDLTDKYIVGDTSLSVSGAAADAKATGDALGTKANADGYYENLTAGSANQLLSTVTIEDKVPYQFRTSGGSADIGDRETDMLVGGSIAWNQLVQDPLLTDANKIVTRYASKSISNGVVTCVPTSDGTERGPSFKIDGTMTNHIYLAVVNLKTTVSGSFKLAISGGDGAIRSITANTWTSLGGLIKATGVASNPYFSAYQRDSITTSDTIEAEKPQFFDLTQMFGSTIADYIYSLEQTTAGAGVAWFKKLFPKPYYAYDAGTLKSVEGVSNHDMVGFNQFDKDSSTPNSTINSSGAVVSGSYNVSDYIEVVPNTVYYAHNIVKGNEARCVCVYDADKSFIETLDPEYPKGTVNYASNIAYITTPSDAHYARIITSVPDECCFNISWDGERDGEYEPYVKQSYPLDDSLTLRGIPKLDSANSLYYDGDTYDSDGTVTRKYVIHTFDGSETIGQQASTDTTNTVGYTLPNAKDVGAVNTGDFISNAFAYMGQSGVAGGAYRRYNDIRMTYNKSAYPTIADFKAYLVGKSVVYELATPTTETADPYQHVQIVNDFGTEEYVSTSIVPVGHYTEYQPNLRAKLEMAPNSPNDGDGDYIVRQSNGENTYVKLVIPQELPTTPSENGTYSLKVTVSDGTATLSWEA